MNAVNASAPAATANAAIMSILRFTNMVALIRPPFPWFARPFVEAHLIRGVHRFGSPNRFRVSRERTVDGQTETRDLGARRRNHCSGAAVRRRPLGEAAPESARRARRQRRGLTRAG